MHYVFTFKPVNELGMFPEEIIITKSGHSFTNWLQYRQVRALISSLMHMYDLFCPLCEFETWIRDSDK